MNTESSVKHVNVPITSLIPVRTRNIPSKAYAKLTANIKAVGLIEPLCVFKEGDRYLILDGYVRHKVLLELGVQEVPCILLPSKDFYTPNHQVNNMSAQEVAKTLRKALEKVDEKALAEAFGMRSLGTRLGTGLDKHLHPDARQALLAGKISRATAREMTYVLPTRQSEIIGLMKQASDWSTTFARAQILETPLDLRSPKEKRNTPWDKNASKKRALVNKLDAAEKNFDFYSGLYRQYVGDLLKLAAYVRQILSRPRLRSHLQERHAEKLALFRSVVEESEGKAGRET